MGATPGYVQVPPDSTGKKIDNTVVDTGAGTVERQVIVVADPSDPDGYAEVLAADPTGTEGGLVVRPISPLDQLLLDNTGSPLPFDPTYIGSNEPTALPSDATWTIRKLSYSGPGVLTSVQARTGVAWTARTSPTPPWS